MTTTHPREIVTHRSDVEGDPNAQLTVRGYAPHLYDVRYDVGMPGVDPYVLGFRHDMPGLANTVNGLTTEVLLAVCIDRLEQFQLGDNPCRENDDAVMYAKAALARLKCRTAKVARAREEVKIMDEMVPDATVGRIKVFPAFFLLSGVKLDREALESYWSAWTKAESAARKLDPTLTTEELEFLRGVPKLDAAKNGFKEFESALKSTMSVRPKSA